MKTLATRVISIILCLAIPCAAMAESTASEPDVLHADFTLGLALHAGGFPPVGAHVKDWETFLSKLTLSGSLDGMNFLHSDSRILMNAALCLNGEETVPFTYDEYGNIRYIVSPAFLGDSIMFQMHNYFEFMLKPFFYLGMPTNYIALLTYPDAAVYLAELYYAPLLTMMEEAHDAALEAEDGESPDTLTYDIPYERLLALCGELNTLATGDDTRRRVQWFLDVLLAELYLSDVVAEGLSQTELVLYLLDPEMQGMTVTETADGMVCTIGDTVVFHKSVADGTTEIAFQLPINEDNLFTFTWNSMDTDGAQDISAAVSVTAGEDTLLALWAEGKGLPAEGSLGGEGTVIVGAGGSELAEETREQTFAFQWFRTAAELPYELDITVDWLHPDTELPALSLYLSAALAQGEESALVKTAYPWQDFFSLNSVSLDDYKERWGLSLGAYLLPVALEMNIGLIDDIVNFMLETDILVSIVE